MAGQGDEVAAFRGGTSCSACGSWALACVLPAHVDISPLRCAACGSFSGSLSDIEIVEDDAGCEGLN